YSQYMFNQFILNPAVAGSDEKIPVVATVRRQWMGIQDAPVTQSVSAHAYTGQYVGIGVNFFNEVAGPSRRTGLSFSAARHFLVNKSTDTWFSFGLSGIFYQFGFDPSKLHFDQPDDPVITTAAISKFVPDAAAGVYLYNAHYYLGFSAQNVFQTPINLFDIADRNYNPVNRVYFLSAGYEFVLSDNLSIQPSTLVRKVFAAPYQIDLNVKATIANHFTIGGSYRSSDAVVVLVGAQIPSVFVGYSYDITLNPLKSYSKGTHEIYLIVKLENALHKSGHFNNHHNTRGHRKNPYRLPVN
ncbi:MAG: type IX secretion system membrane protein PorP/SprF, partial [Cytophagales bacterium]|nr:type IX secretion system membrane protein PorP/SprF [Cytophaga sp.]